MALGTVTFLDDLIARLSRRFVFTWHPNRYGMTLVAADLRLHVLEDGTEYTVVFEPPDPTMTPIHIAARSGDLEAVLRELLAG